jgi:hypothetical protein
MLKVPLGKEWFSKFRSGVNPTENAEMPRTSSNKQTRLNVDSVKNMSLHTEDPLAIKFLARSEFHFGQIRALWKTM